MMGSTIDKFSIKFRFKLLILFAVLLTGMYAGYQLYEKGDKLGCFQLAEDVVPISISAFRADRLQLIAIGDTGTGNKDQKLVAAGMAKVCEQMGCDLILLLGDNIYPDGVQSIHDQQFYSKFEHIYSKIDKPFYAVLGNHDVKQDALSQVLYTLISDKWRMPNYEYIIKTDVADLYALNTNCPLSFASFEDKLSQNKTESSTKPWVIAFAHHSIYSNGTHGDTNILTRLYWELFLEEKVDLYLAGHNHNLAHFKYDNSGTDHIISGAGGNHYRSDSEQEKLKGSSSSASNLFTHNDTGFVWLEINKNKLHLSFHDSTGNTLYEHTKSR